MGTGRVIPAVLSFEYSLTAILHAAHFWGLVKTEKCSFEGCTTAEDDLLQLFDTLIMHVFFVHF